MRARKETRSPVSANMFAAATSLRADLVAVEVSQALRAAGIRSILLRGPLIRRLLYDENESREYVDVDLLVAPSAMEKAERILADLGFEHLSVLSQRTDDWPVWARTWARDADGGTIDLHRTLVGAGVEPDQIWELLSQEVESVDVARSALEGLNAEAIAVIVALHAAHHGIRVSKPLDDVSRAVERLPGATWKRAAELAERLDATAAFAAGLRLVPAGAELAKTLELPYQTSAEIILRASTTPPMALGFEWLSRTPGLRAKLVLVAGKIVPDPEFMRAWSPIAPRGRVGLAIAYAWRPLWLLWHTGPALRAWYRARAQARR